MSAEQPCMPDSILETGNENPRSLFYKKPIKKDNYKLDIEDEDCPQEILIVSIRIRNVLSKYYLEPIGNIFYTLLSHSRSRDAAFNAGREFLEATLDSEEESFEEMEVQEDHKSRRILHKHRQYSNKLMMSEWMLEVPQDYSDKWLMVPCPEGRRCLLVACKGKTRAFNRRGEKLGRFNSALPGGNSREHRNSCTILDCIWLKNEKMYYALDVLAWSNQPMLNCDAEFRMFWLKSQFEDTKEFETRNSHRNTFPILPLPHVSCNEDMSELMEKVKVLEPLDGFLFLHREGQYTNGRTPLVTWLKSFMMEEVLGIQVPSGLDEKPEGYIDYRHYIESTKLKSKTTLEIEMDVPKVET